MFLNRNSGNFQKLTKNNQNISKSKNFLKFFINMEHICFQAIYYVRFQDSFLYYSEFLKSRAA